MSDYYNSGPYTVAFWNTLIDAVNTALAPCSQTTLPHVSAGHIWTVSDIKAVHNALKAGCPANGFTTPDASNIWKQAIIDEIVNALPIACCGGWYWASAWATACDDQIPPEPTPWYGDGGPYPPGGPYRTEAEAVAALAAVVNGLLAMVGVFPPCGPDNSFKVILVTAENVYSV